MIRVNSHPIIQLSLKWVTKWLLIPAISLHAATEHLLTLQARLKSKENRTKLLEILETAYWLQAVQQHSKVSIYNLTEWMPLTQRANSNLSEFLRRGIASIHALWLWMTQSHQFNHVCSEIHNCHIITAKETATWSPPKIWPTWTSTWPDNTCLQRGHPVPHSLAGGAWWTTPQTTEYNFDSFLQPHQYFKFEGI